MRRTHLAAIALLFLAWSAYTFRAQQPPAENAAVERGRIHFEANCSFCHGPDATGARGPDLVRSRLVADDVNGKLIGEVIRDGRPNKGMPAFTMSQSGVADIAAFLHSRVRAATASNRVSMSYPLSRLLTGNAAEGKAFFYGAGGCSACHSPSGDLVHVARKYEPLELEVRMLSPRDAVTTVTVTLSSGKEVSGRLEHPDEFSVALIDSSGWYQSFPRNRVKVQVHDPLAAHHALLGKLTQAEVHNLFAYMETLK